ncbi:hypothetical protein CARUB_v10019246mg [Capsella rubella]|uniref:FKB95-like N-terminal Kelch domain-containing protein n=1 Tax=Capsella rubella TaxID=81985 RepID=R0FSP2_9BRAS|nr:hypothetical protein CARUB_v10019246mg [Capsella rubella]
MCINLINTHASRLVLKTIVGCNSFISGLATTSVKLLRRKSKEKKKPPLSVWILDCRTVLIDQKIYVIGGCDVDSWFEVLDIKTQTWRALSSPGAGHELYNININVNPDAFEGKLYVATHEKDYTYDPKDGTWKAAREESSWRELWDSCVIDNVMYSYNYPGIIKWYDYEGRVWREIKGLEGLPSCTRLVCNYGGKLVVMWRQWHKKHSENPNPKIWCAKTALEKRHKDEIWGKTEWRNSVLEIPMSFYSFLCVAVSIC